MLLATQRTVKFERTVSLRLKHLFCVSSFTYFSKQSCAQIVKYLLEIWYTAMTLSLLLQGQLNLLIFTKLHKSVKQENLAPNWNQSRIVVLLLIRVGLFIPKLVLVEKGSLFLLGKLAC